MTSLRIHNIRTLGILSLLLLLMAACNTSTLPHKVIDQMNDGLGRSWMLMAQDDTLHQAIDTVWIQAPAGIETADLSLTKVYTGSEQKQYGAAEVIHSKEPEFVVRVYMDEPGTWRLKITTEDSDPIKLEIPVQWDEDYQSPVIRKNRKGEKTDWLAGILQPGTHQYGIHPAEIALFAFSEDRFQPAEVSQITLMPWMHMGDEKGHGSPYNKPAVTDPSLLPGHYQGQLSYTMPGSWELRLLVPQDNSTDTLSADVHVAKKK
jgi:hypothetical protein